MFLRWFWDEVEPEYKNPIDRVKAPKVVNEPLDPIPISNVKKLIETCTKKDFYDIRDAALFSFLLDTGARATETISIDLRDVDLRLGSVLLRETKNGEYRTCFVGKKNRKAIRSYLKYRGDNFDDESPLWAKVTGEPLTYWGLNEILKRRALLARIPKPGLHDFRRAFVTNAVRSGMDIESLRKLVGHKSYQVIRRYLKLNTDDIRSAHYKASPVDNNL